MKIDNALLKDLYDNSLSFNDFLMDLLKMYGDEYDPDIQNACSEFFTQESIYNRKIHNMKILCMEKLINNE